MTSDRDYRITDIAHELPRITAQLERIGNLLEKLLETELEDSKNRATTRETEK